MRRAHQFTLAIQILGLLYVSTGVNFAADRYKVLDRDALQKRIAALYKAEENGDWKAFFELVSPEVKKDTTFEEFLKDSAHRDFKMVSWKVRRIRGAERDSEYPPQVTSGAEVLMDVSVLNSDGSREKVEDQTDYWVQLDGVWYWAWRGWPYD